MMLMEKKVNNVPELRFPEFAGEWLVELLENLSVRGSGHTPNKNFPSYYNGGIKWISLADSKKLDNGYIDDTKIEISKEGLKKSSAVLHPPETVLLSRDAGVGKSAVMKNEMAVSQHFIVWRPKPNLLAAWFLYYRLQIHKREFERIAVGSTIKTIGLPYFKKLTISTTSLSEQQKIASFLTTVDKKIEQLSRKKELFEQYKKGVMQKIFSQEIRFKDDNGQTYPDWEEKRLEEFLIPTLREIPKPHTPYLAIGIRSHCKGTFQKPNSEPKKIAMDKLFIVKENDFVVNITFAWEGALAIVKKEDEGGLVSHRFPTYTFNKNKVLINFFRYVFIQKRFRFTMDLISPGGAGRNRVLSKKELLKVQWKFPAISEQQKIATFLSSIDTKIKTVQTQLTQTQNFKKGLLQKMFV